ncbi:MAG: methylenetetrahydrofolate reductase [Acidobacteriota bacterium]
MKVTEHLERASRPLISFEIIPPLRGGSIRDLMGLIDHLVPHDPPFIDITSHAAEVIYEETPDGLRKKIKRKRPGTLGICALIQNKYNIDAVPHVLCKGFTRQETEDFLIELRYLGIDNVLAIRGDDSGYKKPLRDGRSANTYASDLIQQINHMNAGTYLEQLLDAHPTEFCVGTSGYPEKHFEAPNLATDIRRTKEKVEAGAEYIVTQMFFDNRVYFEYVDACRAAGIDVPIIPGLKIITKKRQLSSIPRTFHCDIPASFADEIERAKNNSEVAELGIAWTLAQTLELLEADVPAVHYYVMQDSTAINRLLDKLDR